MMDSAVSSALELTQQAASQGKLTPGAVENLTVWLTEPRYADYLDVVLEHINAERWQELDDVFWTIIPFGTGGRRGKMHPIGSNAINDRTIGESAQGLAEYVLSQIDHDSPACAIAYDTRHRSRHFAELCSEIMVANGFKVWFLDGFRSTPALSFAVREKKCDCGIMVTASHNPPSDNAVKAYWSTGGQLLPPHDTAVIERVMNVDNIKRANFAEAMADGRVEYCQEEIDRDFNAAILRQSCPGPRDLKIIYSPLHGVGSSVVLPALESDGFKQVELFGPHGTPDPDFPNVPGHVSNPENPAVFDLIIEQAKTDGTELILATDPDADRVGCSASRTLADPTDWEILTGNQIGSLMTEFLLKKSREAGTLRPDQYVVKTLVTTELIRRIANDYGVEMVGDLLVGFKWIGGAIEERDPKKFLIGAEESYGFLIGDHVRDKDAGVSAMLLAELAAAAKAEGLSLHQKLDALFLKYGCHTEWTVSVQMPGSEGMGRMKELMAGYRTAPPKSIGGIPVLRVRDYLNQTILNVKTNETAELAGPKGDMVILDLELEGNYVAVRPSGTEPKVKYYMFAYDRPTEALDEVKLAQAARLDALLDDLKP
jgi:phosphoglucomutase